MQGYGIDLGTSTCLVSRVVEDLDGNFEVKCLTAPDGSQSFPSVVSFTGDTGYVVGEKANRRMPDHPDSTVELVKVRLGKTKGIRVVVDGREEEKSPQEVSSYLLRHLNIVHGGMVGNAVLTVPAFFDQSQKEATMQAAHLADIAVDEMIEEPTAAIMYHIFSQHQKQSQWIERGRNSNVLVFDFGGGTLDLSAIGIRWESGGINPKVLCVDGDNELGGSLLDFIFTRKIIGHLAAAYEGDTFIAQVATAYEGYYSNYMQYRTLRFPDHTANETKQFIFRLMRDCERVKKALSSADKELLSLDRNYRPIQVTRRKFEEWVLLDDSVGIKWRITDALERVCMKLRELNEPPDRVLLVGGSSQIPLLAEIIIGIFGCMGITRERISLSDDFEQAVALGAAILSGISQGMEIPPFMGNRCKNIVSRDIEIEHGGLTSLFVKVGEEYPLIDRKYKLSIKHALSQTVDLRLNEAIVMNDRSRQSKLICQIAFHLPFYYTGDEIELLMSIDRAGLYQIRAVHLDTGEAAEYESIREFSLTNQEMDSVSAKIRGQRDNSTP